MNVQRLQQRAALIQAVRFFFMARRYLEVETPIRLPALIPEAHIVPLPSASWFLQTSPELCMKRLLAAGVPRLFQICKCFRDRERGQRHLPEFTMLEWYRLAGDYQDLMIETQALLQELAASVQADPGFDQHVAALLLQPDWQKMTVQEAFARHAPLALEAALATDCFEEMLVVHVEPRLGRDRPCFLHDYPVALGSLAKTSTADQGVAERFELYIQGVEVANGFSELTDPVEQRRRFLAEAALAHRQGVSFGEMPEKFLEDLAAVETACGIALGLDRLVMLLTGAACIDEVVCFTPEAL
jgi:lysyl-tRNA synthetase class 2